MTPFRIAVVDGMGGSIGAHLIKRMREALPETVEILALGTNSTATGKMMKARASRGATGENALRVSLEDVNVLVGSLSILIPNSMMGELTPSISESCSKCKARKILLPLTNPRLEILGMEDVPLPDLIDDAVERIKLMMQSD